MNTASKIVKIIVTESTLMAVFAVVVLIFSKKANFAQFEGNHCAFLFILTYNSEILCKFVAEFQLVTNIKRYHYGDYQGQSYRIILYYYLLAELKNRLKISIFLWRKKLCISLIFSNFVVSNYKVIYFTLCPTCMQIS